MSRPANLGLDEQLCFALYAAANTVIRAYRPLLEQIGITYPQYLVMLVLWHQDGLPVREIADHLALPPHALSPILDRLADAGVVTRDRDAGDGRITRVNLTVAGAALETEASRIQASVACKTQLSPAALAALREQLHDLVRTMRADPHFASRTELVPAAPRARQRDKSRPGA